MTRIRDFAKLMLALPFLMIGIYILGVATEGVKMHEQGWRYFVPTFDGLAEWVQFASLFVGLIGGVVIGRVYPEAVVYFWVPFWIFGPGLALPILIAQVGERHEREKILRIAEPTGDNQG